MRKKNEIDTISGNGKFIGHGGNTSFKKLHPQKIPKWLNLNINKMQTMWKSG